MIDLDAIKARWKVSAARRQGAEGSLAAMRSASDVPALVAEVERLTLMLETSRDTVERMDRLYRDREREDAERYVETERLRAELAEVETERDILASRLVELEPSGFFRVDL